MHGLSRDRYGEGLHSGRGIAYVRMCFFRAVGPSLACRAHTTAAQKKRTMQGCGQVRLQGTKAIARHQGRCARGLSVRPWLGSLSHQSDRQTGHAWVGPTDCPALLDAFSQSRKLQPPSFETDLSRSPPPRNPSSSRRRCSPAPHRPSVLLILLELPNRPLHPRERPLLEKPLTPAFAHLQVLCAPCRSPGRRHPDALRAQQPPTQTHRRKPSRIRSMSLSPNTTGLRCRRTLNSRCITTRLSSLSRPRSASACLVPTRPSLLFRRVSIALLSIPSTR